jgi:hypothetical protein
MWNVHAGVSIWDIRAGVSVWNVRAGMSLEGGQLLVVAMGSKNHASLG